MRGLKSWIEALPDEDRALLDGWLVTVEPAPAEEPEAVAEAEVVDETVVIKGPKMIPEYTCQRCGYKWTVPMAWCAPVSSLVP